MQMIMQSWLDPYVKDNEQQNICSIQNNLGKTKHWMHLDRLKMNDQKTKFIMYGNNVQLSKCSTKHIDISNGIIGCSDMKKFSRHLCRQ